MKKLVIALILLFTLVVPSMAEARGFSGGHSSFGHSSTFGSHSTSTKSSYSGYKSSSSILSRTKYRSRSYSRGGSIWSHAGAFGAGMLFGRMFHPFGGYYFGHSYGFSLFGFLFDIVMLYIVYKIIKRIFFRRRRY